MDFRERKMPHFEFSAVPSTVFSTKALNKCLTINLRGKKGRQLGVFGALKKL